MPIPKPKTGEKQSEFMMRCVPRLMGEYGKEQSIAICYSSFRDDKMSLNDSYSDYPESAKNNAKKVLKWRDKYGDEVKGMTRVGWTRANQLAKGENISRDTIARMASFMRHKKNSAVNEENKATPWKDRGRVAWLGWGGTSGINWAINKLKTIDKK